MLSKRRANRGNGANPQVLRGPTGNTLPPPGKCRPLPESLRTLPFWYCETMRGTQTEMLFDSLINGPAAAIVLGGTLGATLLRCGWRECATTAAEIAQLWGKPFNADTARADLAVQVQEIRRDGVLRAQPHVTGDAEFDEATDAMIRQRSISALLLAHERHKARRQEMSDIAVRLFAQAAEFAPVFGMVGTLISLSRLPSGIAGGGDFAGAIAMAVQTTLYGLLAANLLFAPIARLIERRASAEELQRQRLVDWLAAQLSGAVGRPIAVGQGPARQGWK